MSESPAPKACMRCGAPATPGGLQICGDAWKGCWIEWRFWAPAHGLDPAKCDALLPETLVMFDRFLVETMPRPPR